MLIFKKNENIIDFLFCCSIIYELISIMTSLPVMMFFGTFGIWILIFAYAGLDRVSRPALFCFEITNFVFLLGGTFFSYILAEEPLFAFDNNILIYTYLIIFLSQAIVFVVYRILDIKRFQRYKPYSSQELSDTVLERIRKFSLVIILISTVPSLIVTIGSVVYAAENSYNGLYLRSDNGFSFLVNKLSQLFIISVFIYLSTKPTKKQSIFPIAIFLGIRAVSLFSGRRTDFVLSLITIFFYVLVRNKLDPNEKWFTIKETIVVLILLPIFILILVNVNNIRYGQESTFSISQGILTFFKDQGVSITVIEYGKQLQKSIPKQPYFFGPIIDFMKYNEVTSLFHEFEEYAVQSKQQAMLGASFADTISYLVIPYGYSVGRGLGSCYIAEAYQTLGIFGVVLINVIFGLVLNVIDSRFGLSVIGSSFYLFMLMRILYAPRSTSLSFISSTFTVTNILMIVGVYLITKHFSFSRNEMCLKI